MHQIDKLNLLYSQRQKIFHTSDLRLIWQIDNENTLYSTISRYIKNGVLFPVQKGMYSVLPLEKIDPLVLAASLIHDFTYLSCETVLFRAGIINQHPYSYTFVSLKTQKFEFNGHSFISRQLAPKFLYNQAGVVEVNGVFAATPERALVDMLYFNPKYYFDNESMINWKEVKKMRREIGYMR